MDINNSSALVLVIDDEQSVREAAIDILELEGIAALTAADGTTGISLFREHQAKIALIILDLSMPGLSGTETFHQLRQINPHVPILLSSGYTAEEIVTAFDGQKQVGFLNKPYRIDTFIKAIKKHIQAD
jgi:CheY-like chemotaxis protein